MDDSTHQTIVSASTVDKELKGKVKSGGNIEAAKLVGELVGKRAVEKGDREDRLRPRRLSISWQSGCAGGRRPRSRLKFLRSLGRKHA